jgi:magnesium chelatase subunit D
MTSTGIEFPFNAVTGQAEFKTALLLVAIYPAIGGVLISGPRGSAKSTLARSLGAVLCKDSGAHSQPFITLPLGTSDEMLLGTLDLQQVLDEQQLSFHPGLLAKAHGGILYVDEVNLLADTLVDLLLDVATSGINRVERDGISHVHESQFVLVGTMNPDEGELRAQLLDRFGLMVKLDNQYTLAQRIEIVQRREAFDRDPRSFLALYADQQRGLVEQIKTAQTLLPQVKCSDTLRKTIAMRCANAQVDGLRADIVWYRSALAHAALCGRSEVLALDVDAVEPLVLTHRCKPEQPPPPSSNAFRSPPGARDSQPTGSSENETTTSDGQWGEMPAQFHSTDDPAFNLLDSVLGNVFANVLGNVTPRGTACARTIVKNFASRAKGNIVRGNSRSAQLGNTVDWFSTLIHNPRAWPPKKLRFQKQKTASQVLHLVLLDASSSTIGHRLINHAKTIVLGIADQAYLARQQLQVLSFRGQKVENVLRAMRAPKHLKPRLDQVRAGGGTPLRAALLRAKNILIDSARRVPGVVLRTYLITDGRSTAHIDDINLPGDTFVIDTEQSTVKRGRCEQIAHDLCAQYIFIPARV